MICPKCDLPGHVDEWGIPNMTALSCLNSACTVGPFYVFETTDDKRETVRAMAEAAKKIQEDAPQMMLLLDIFGAIERTDQA